MVSVVFSIRFGLRKSSNKTRAQVYVGFPETRSIVLGTRLSEKTRPEVSPWQSRADSRLASKKLSNAARRSVLSRATDSANRTGALFTVLLQKPRKSQPLSKFNGIQNRRRRTASRAACAASQTYKAPLEFPVEIYPPELPPDFPTEFHTRASPLGGLILCFAVLRILSREVSL